MSDIEDLIRRIAASEAERVAREVVADHVERVHEGKVDIPPFDASDALPPSLRCRVLQGRGPTAKQCIRERGHGQRHRYGEREPATTAMSKWVVVSSIQIPGPTGVKVYDVRAGSPVKVRGWGRAGAAQDGWWISKIERNNHLGESGALLESINVEVSREGSHYFRTVKADKLVYVKPTAKKMSARRAKVTT